MTRYRQDGEQIVMKRTREVLDNYGVKNNGASSITFCFHLLDSLSPTVASCSFSIFPRPTVYPPKPCVIEAVSCMGTMENTPLLTSYLSPLLLGKTAG